MAFRILSVFQTLHDFDEAFEAYRNSTYRTFAVSTSSKTPNRINYILRIHVQTFRRPREKVS
jgi:hypothetical protein